LDYVGNGSKKSAMQTSVMPKAATQAPKVLKHTIHPLMPGSSNRFHPLVGIVQTIWCLSKAVAITVGTIRQVLFSAIQDTVDAISSNCKIWPMTWGIGTIHPNNPPGLYTDADFVPKACMVDLEREPLFTERCWFVDFEVRSIDCDKTNTAIVPHVSIPPFYLG
jgi:hypothetical protein